jgi:hypothetical protein
MKKSLLTHLCFNNYKISKNSYTRKSDVIVGLCNQLYSLLFAMQISKVLERELYISGFYIDYRNHVYVPLSKIIQLDNNKDSFYK